jgi:hypothetical protein
MFETAIERAEERLIAGLAGLVENPNGSYGWKLPRVKLMNQNLEAWAAKKRIDLNKVCGFGVCCNCMLGGARFKVSGIWYYNLDFEPDFWTVCRNLNGICDRTGLPHQSMKPVVEDGVVIRYPTEEEAEYPLLMVQHIARAAKRFLDAQPKLRAKAKYDFLEIYSGPNAPTTMAVAVELGAAEGERWAELLTQTSATWYHKELESDSDESDGERERTPQARWMPSRLTLSPTTPRTTSSRMRRR